MTAVNSSFQAVVFILDNTKYALDIALVQEIIRPPQITPLPQTPDYYLGIANLRGTIVPVIDPARLLLGKFSTIDNDARVVVLAVNNRKFGIIVGSVSEVIRISPDNMQDEKVLDGISSSDILGVAQINDDIILLPDPACFTK